MCLFSLVIETLAAVSVARLRAYRLRIQNVISAKCKQSREREDIRQTAASATQRTCTVSFCYFFIISNKQFEQEFQAVT